MTQYRTLPNPTILELSYSEGPAIQTLPVLAEVPLKATILQTVTTFSLRIHKEVGFCVPGLALCQHIRHTGRGKGPFKAFIALVGGLLTEKVWYSCEGLTWQMTNNYHY